MNKGYLSFLSLDSLKIYFDVTNSYVLHKLKIILFPFLLKEDDWKRGQNGEQGAFGTTDEAEEDRFTPRNDLQAPDLYIPLMSFVSFILLTGFHLGISSKASKDALADDTKVVVAEFNADKLTYVFSKSLFFWLFEALILKG